MNNLAKAVNQVVCPMHKATTALEVPLQGDCTLYVPVGGVFAARAQDTLKCLKQAAMEQGQ